MKNKNKWKKWKNEIMNNRRKKLKKWKTKKKWKQWKNWKQRKMKRFGLHTQNLRRIPGFTVVAVTFFVELIDDFHDFVSECVSFPKKINNPFRVVGHRFFRRKMTFFIGRETKTHILPTKINEKGPLTSYNNYSFRIINHSTTTTTIQSGRLHPTLGSWSLLSPKQAAQPNPSCPVLCRQDTTFPWSTDYGGNIFCWTVIQMLEAAKF